WMHNNMLTVDGRKMARSIGNFITLEELFTGNHERLDAAYHPMVVRFFALQAHYRSVVDFSNDALKAAEKGYQRLMAGLQHAEALLADEIAGEEQPVASPRLPTGPLEDDIAKAGRTVPRPGELSGSTDHDEAVIREIEGCWRAMSDDFHTPTAIAALFELSRLIQRPEHSGSSEAIRLGAARFIRAFSRYVLGLRPESEVLDGGGRTVESERLDAALRLLIDMRGEARSAKDFATADRIRDQLAEAGIRMEDRKDGTTTWTVT
ncbi:MAG: cysteine--tRNA ligase, partial [Spirochaetales bacterium]|nr:cysteine--tRNA ligase [Spirochaetales bacterium]